jgi:hypothetical protein
MNFLTPLAFILTGLLPVIIALYVLKLRRQEQHVSSTYLWRELVRDTAANAPWQRLRPNLLLLLQILFLIALILALARPFSWTTSVAGDHLILIIDISASMAATDLTPTRLQAALDQARHLIADMPADIPVTLITAGDEAHVALSASDDRGRIQRALDDLQRKHNLHPSNGGTDIESALALASAIATRDTEAEIVVLSDGGVQLPEHWSSPTAIRYMPIGTTGDNQAISALSLDAETAGQSILEALATSAFVRVTNYAPQQIERRLILRAFADPADPVDPDDTLLEDPAGQLIAVRDLVLPPDDAVVLVIPDLPQGTASVKATLEGEDPLALDDQAWAVAPRLSGSGGHASVTIVGPGNRFLETALTLIPSIEVTTVSPEDYAHLTEGAADNTLTVFDGELPNIDDYPSGALLFIGPLRSTPFFSVTGALTFEPAGLAPRPVTVDDPLLRFVDVQDIAIQTAAHIPLPEWGRPVIVARSHQIHGQGEQHSSPLLIVGQRETRRLAVLAFDLRDSDLPLRVAFPLLLANLVDYLTPGVGNALPEQVSPGQPLLIPLPPQAQAGVITCPQGNRVRLTPENGSVRFADTTTPGVYTVTWEDAETDTPTRIGRFAVNGYSALESDIAPRAQLGITSTDREIAVTHDHTAARREWWRPLAWTALTLLIVEWLIQYRGSLVFIAAKLIGRQPAGSLRFDV